MKEKSPRFHAGAATEAEIDLSVIRENFRLLTKGEKIGYGGIFSAPADMRVAIVSLGYADGLFRGTAGGNLLWRGHRLPIVGRISMDQCAVSIGELPIAAGDAVTVFDRGGTNLPALAQAAGTVPYELLVSLSRRAFRVYRK